MNLLDVLTNWAPAIWPTLVLAAVLYVPGSIVLWLSGASAMMSLVLSPVLVTAVAGGAAIAFSKVGVPWDLWSVLIVFLVLVVIVVACRTIRARGIPSVRRWHAPAAAMGVAWSVGLIVNAMVVMVRYMRANGSASAVSYEYDTIWHFSVIRWILDHRDASSLDVGLVDGTSGSHFYPAAWHGLVALTASSTGTELAVAVQASVLVVLLVVWPISMAALARELFGRSPVIEGAVLACAYLPAVYPVGFLEFGVLYSNFFSYALVPAGVIVCLRALRKIQEWRSIDETLPGPAVVLATVALPVACGTAQPNSAFVLLVIILPAMYVTVDRLVRRQAPTGAWRYRVAAHAAFTVVLVVCWRIVHDSSFLSRTVSVDWYKYESPAQAVGSWVFFGNGTSGQILLGVAVLAGVVWAWTARQSRWFVLSYALLGFFFVVCASFDGGPGSLRDYLVGFWYHDSPRLAATAAIVGLPFIGYAAARATQAAQAALEADHSWIAHRAGLALPVVLVAAVIVVTAFGSAQRSRSSLLRDQAEETDAQWLSPTEEAFLSEVKAHVGDSPVANNPFDGSAMGYSLNDINMVFKALPGNWMGAATHDQDLFIDQFAMIANAPEVCSAADQEDIRYAVVLRHGDREVFQDGPDKFPGLEITPETPGFELVLQSESDGALKLYRVLPCAVEGA